VNLSHLLMRTARVSPDRPALYVGRDLVCTYGELMARAAGLGAFMSNRLGLAPGDRVALWMSNIPEYFEVLYGAWFAGLAVVPVNAKLHPRELLYILEDSGVSVLFVSEDLADGITPLIAHSAVQTIMVPGTAEYLRARATTPLRAPVDRAANDVCWLFYTSGTTGRPKGVMATNANLLAMIACFYMDVDSVGSQDSSVYAAPLSHAAGMYSFPHVMHGSRHVLPPSRGFDPAELLDLAGFHGDVCMFAAPTMVTRLVSQVEANGADCSGFRTIVYGGGPMYVEDIQRALKVMGQRFVQIYGQGESPMTITALPRRYLKDSGHERYAARIGSVGIAQTLVEVRVADAEGRTLPDGETGEVLVRGPTVMRGYWNNPDATAKTVRDGWLFTGDVGSLDLEGFLTLKDRSKDVIISGGSNIYPREVEEVILRHPRVREVSVIGRHHSEWGEEVVAFVVVEQGAPVQERELDALCLENIARFKRPKHYRFVSALPKNSYGKVLKTALREQLAEESARQGAPA
jgi:long-chain acyl-CoA synthetase